MASSSSKTSQGPYCLRPRKSSPLAVMLAAWGAAAMASFAPKASAASIERGTVVAEELSSRSSSAIKPLRNAIHSLARRKAILSDSDMVTIAGKVPLDAVLLIGAALLFALLCAAYIAVRVKRGERGEMALERKQARRDLRLRGSSSTSGHSSPRRGSKEKVPVAPSTVNSATTAVSSTAPLVPDALKFPKLEQVTSSGSRAAVMSSSRAGHRISSATGGYRVSMVGERKSMSSQRPALGGKRNSSSYAESRKSLHGGQGGYREVVDAPPAAGPPRPGSKYRSRAMSDDAVLQVPVLRPHRTNTNSSRGTESLTDLEIQTDDVSYAPKRRPTGPRAPAEHRQSTTVARGVNLAAQRSEKRGHQPVAVNPQSVERSYSASRPGNHRSSSSRGAVPSAQRQGGSVREPFGKLEVRRSDSDLERYVDPPARPDHSTRIYDMMSTSSSFTSPSITGAPLSPPEAIRGGFETPPAEKDEAASGAPWMGSEAWKGFMSNASGGRYVEAPTTETPVRRGSSRKAASSRSYYDVDSPQKHQGWRAYDAPPPPAPRYRSPAGSPTKMPALLSTASNERPAHRRQGTGSSAGGRPRGARPMGGTYDVDVEALGAHDDHRLL